MKDKVKEKDKPVIITAEVKKCDCGQIMRDLQNTPDGRCDPRALRLKAQGYRYWCRCGRYLK